MGRSPRLVPKYFAALKHKLGSRRMEVRDPLYGLIEYDETEERIINSGLFQRLRSIRQLALASIVYPGAHHTRFEHCIGTMHLAGKVAKRLGFLDDDQKTLRFAGLLHDIGHGPFSHVSEQIMEERAKALVKYHEADRAHEMMSIILVNHLNALAKVSLNTTTLEEIVRLLKKQNKRSLQKDVISGPLDVDKLDYLRRDSYFSGVQYGVFDLDKVMDSFVQIGVSSEEKQLGIDEEGVYAVEQLLFAKYHMNAQVYQHRIRRITDAMLVRGIIHALDEGISEVNRLFEPEDSIDYVNRYLDNNDNTLMNLILTKGKNWSREYFRRLSGRRLLKEVFSIKIDDSNFPDGIELMNIMNLTKEQLQEIETKAAEVFSQDENRVSPSLVIADRQNIPNPTFRSQRVRIDSDTIMVKLKSGQRKLFREVSKVFSNPGVDPEMDILYVYLPLDWIGDRKERDKFIEERREKMTREIRKVIK